MHAQRAISHASRRPPDVILRKSLTRPSTALGDRRPGNEANLSVRILSGYKNGIWEWDQVSGCRSAKCKGQSEIRIQTCSCNLIGWLIVILNWKLQELKIQFLQLLFPLPPSSSYLHPLAWPWPLGRGLNSWDTNRLKACFSNFETFDLLIHSIDEVGPKRFMRWWSHAEHVDLGMQTLRHKALAVSFPLVQTNSVVPIDSNLNWGGLGKRSLVKAKLRMMPNCHSNFTDAVLSLAVLSCCKAAKKGWVEGQYSTAVCYSILQYTADDKCSVEGQYTTTVYCSILQTTNAELTASTPCYKRWARVHT